jgi:phage/plasmid-like protein (TIGR03299 family)
MAHEIDMSNNRANMAFAGSRKDIWHGLGQVILDTDSPEECAKKAGLEWRAIKCPAYAALACAEFDHLPQSDRFREVPDKFFIARSDTGAPLGFATDAYRVHQPAEVIAWFKRYLSADSRFRFDTLGSLRGGATIWGMATFNGEITVAGDAHKSRLLMTTTFDSSGATINKATMQRVVCANTLRMSLYDDSAEVRTRHNTTFNPDKVSAELGAIAQSFERFKALGDAMVQVQMSKEDMSSFFKALLDIPFDAKREDISTKKLNNFEALTQAYGETVREGTPALTQWTALNAVTRYVDHAKHVRGVGNPESRVLSAEFGSGANMKAKALQLLLPAVKHKLAA